MQHLQQYTNTRGLGWWVLFALIRQIVWNIFYFSPCQPCLFINIFLFDALDYNLYIIDGVLYVVPSQNSHDRPEGPLWGPSAGTLAWAGCRPSYMLVVVIQTLYNICHCFAVEILTRYTNFNNFISNKLSNAFL